MSNLGIVVSAVEYPFKYSYIVAKSLKYYSFEFSNYSIQFEIEINTNQAIKICPGHCFLSRTNSHEIFLAFFFPACSDSTNALDSYQSYILGYLKQKLRLKLV